MKKTYLILLLSYFFILILNSGVIIRNPGCNGYDQTGICKSCSTRFYKDQNNICQPVNTNCKTYSQLNGDCLSCYSGFGLIQGTCLPGIQAQIPLDPNCNQFIDNVCVKCSYGYYFDKNKSCVKADPSCQTFNQLNGACTSCYQGFIVNNGKCVRQPTKIVDPNCNQFDSNNICIKCSSGFYFKQGSCAKIDDSCKTFNLEKGYCIDCYSGYTLDKNFICVKEQVKPNLNPYCAQWRDNICLRCAKGTIYDRNGICTLLDSNCKQYQTQTSICKACYDGYNLQNGSCVKSAIQTVKDLNCNSFNQNGVCTKCSSGYYFNNLKVCVKIDDSCKNFNIVSLRCMQCYSGYQLDNFGQCIRTIEQVADPNCAEWNGKLCKKCSFGSAFNNQGLCVILDSQCKQYNQLTKLCKACYEGYQLNSFSVCVKSAIKDVADPLCAEWKNNICTKCSFGSFFNVKIGLCSLIDSSCKTANQITGACLTCYDGYQLSNIGTCIKIVQQLSDVNCAEWKGKICLKCSFGAAFNNFGKCTILDPQCRQYDMITGLCKGCYSGYQLNNMKTCIQQAPKQVTDPLCAEWNNQICIKCSFGSFFGVGGKCTQVDTICKQSNKVNGACLSCYDGYQLNSGTCIKVIQDVSDVNCAQWNGKACIKCSIGSNFNSFGKCVLLDAQCKQYNLATSICKSCYSGYQLDRSNICVKSAIKSVSDPNCAQWNGDICTKCSQGTYFNAFKTCTLVDSLCLLFNKINGDCLSCYSGYSLSLDKKCVKSVQNDNSNPLCSQWDISNKICKKCSTGSFFNGQGICQTVDPLCKTSNFLNGACTTCFDGYKLSGSKCVVSQQQARDPLCKSFKGTACTECSFGSYFNSKGICQLSDSSCLTFDKATGLCLTCYSGYLVKQGKCQIDTSDPYCAQYNNNICARCSQGYYFQRDGKCTIADPLCKTFNPMNGKCLSCYTGYQIKSGLCIVSVQKPKDPNCASFKNDICSQCSKGFIFDQKGSCVLINPLCKTYNSITGACLTCYSGYAVEGTTCVIDKSNQNSNCAQYFDGLCIRCASRTFMNSKGQCQKVSQDCRTYNDFSGNCLSCYSGFSLKNGRCETSLLLGGCSQYDGNGKCTKCASGYFVNNGQCSLIDAQCAKFNMNNKKCQGCYSGYTLLEGKCQISKVKEEFEVKNCVAYNVENKCIQCFDRFYLTNNQCKEVNIFCKTYDLISGLCTSCYSGFNLNAGICKR